MKHFMPHGAFPGSELAARLELAEAACCEAFCLAAARVYGRADIFTLPACGGVAAHYGPGDMLNAVKGPGLRGAVSEAEWDAVEVTFAANRSPVAVDVSPFAESLFFELLRARGYRIGGFENVLYRQIDAANSRPESLKQGWELELVTPARAELWTSIMNRGFSNEGPEPPFSVNFGKVRATLANAMMLLLLIDGAPAAGAALSCSEGVAHFGGAAVLPAYRGRGAQRALTAARIELAHEQGCDVAKLDVLGGSISHRNAAASGFAVAYTRPQMVKTL